MGSGGSRSRLLAAIASTAFTSANGGEGDRALGRISGAAWTKDGGLALDILMATTATRTFYAEQLADTRWPMYAPTRHRRPAGRDYRKLHQLVAVRLWSVESWPTAAVRVVRPPEFPIVIARRGESLPSRR
jgi:hypothetical protein